VGHSQRSLLSIQEWGLQGMSYCLCALCSARELNTANIPKETRQWAICNFLCKCCFHDHRFFAFFKIQNQKAIITQKIARARITTISTIVHTCVLSDGFIAGLFEFLPKDFNSSCQEIGMMRERSGF